MSNSSVTIQSLKEIIDLFNELVLSRENIYVFRGYTQQDQIYPSIIRRFDYSKAENKLCIEFEKYSGQFFKTYSPIEFLSCAQHYGIPTRLLDFTYNPFIALSFALNSDKLDVSKYTEPEDSQFYYVRYGELNRSVWLIDTPKIEYGMRYGGIKTDSASSLTISVISQYEEEMNKIDFYNNESRMFMDCLLACYGGERPDNASFRVSIERKIKNNEICFVTPNFSNQRIMMQQGLFMFPYTLDKEKHKSIITSKTSLIKIPKELRQESISYLDTLGYNAFRLMPDLSSICTKIKETVRNEYT